MSVVMTNSQYASMPGVTTMAHPAMMAPQMSPTLMAPPVMVTRPGTDVPTLPVGVYGEDAKKAILRNLPPGSYSAEDKGKGRDDGKYHGECTCTVM